MIQPSAQGNWFLNLGCCGSVSENFNASCFWVNQKNRVTTKSDFLSRFGLYGLLSKVLDSVDSSALRIPNLFCSLFYMCFLFTLSSLSQSEPQFCANRTSVGLSSLQTLLRLLYYFHTETYKINNQVGTVIYIQYLLWSSQLEWI